MEIRSWLSPRHRQRNRLHAYIEGALEGAERAQFEAAMARDPRPPSPKFLARF